jgi:hypothetical protein
MPAVSDAQRKMMCREAAHPGSTQAKGIAKKSAEDYCTTKGKLVGHVKPAPKKA